MFIQRAIANITEKKLDEMKENFFSALNEKAVGALEERKQAIAQNYFGTKG